MQHLHQGVSNPTIREVEGASRRAIQTIKRKVFTYGTASIPEGLSRNGRPPKLDDNEATGLKVFLEHKPWAYLDEMQYYLFDDWGVYCDVSTISRALKKHKISRKVIQREAAERSQICRDDYMLTMSKLQDHQLCFLDESAANEHTTYRKFGWAPFGITPKAIRPVKRSERHSVLPCYDKNGVICCHIYQGSINGPRFE